MRRTLTSALMIGALLAVGLPSNAEAQQNKTRQITTGTLIAALNNISANINDLRALNDLTIEDVRVVDVDDVLNDNNVEAFNNALNRNNTEILNLRNVLNDNEVIKNALNNVDVAINDVVAIEVLSGEVVVFRQ